MLPARNASRSDAGAVQLSYFGIGNTRLPRHQTLQFFKQIRRCRRIDIIAYFADIFNAGGQTFHQIKVFGKKWLYVIIGPERNAYYERPLQGRKNIPENPASVYFFQNFQAFFAYLYVFPQ